MKYFFFVFLATLNLIALDFKVASYNVENFFDLHYDKTEYKEYHPNTKTWNNKAYTQKLINITKVLQDLDADIVALQEIESQLALDAIAKKNTQYKYTQFLKNKNAAIGVALLSKFPIVKVDNIIINKYDKYSRDILKVTVEIEKKPLLIYVNHWRSKKAKESHRIKYALALKKDLEKLDDFTDYIILGDLNSDYNEYQTFKYNKRLNDSFNITGINQILNTTIGENFVQKSTIMTYDSDTIVHFNTWLELPYEKRFSAKFKTQNNTPDNIILSKGLFDNKNISYISDSFNTFTPHYLYKNNKIIRWNKSKKTGFSDHLPIYASFSTQSQNYALQKSKPKLNKTHSISHLYTIEQISDYRLKNIIVLYTTDKIALVKQKDDNRAIMIYASPMPLKNGYTYDLTVDKIDTYFGLKEITKFSQVQEKEKYPSFKSLYIDANTIDLNDRKFTNNVVFNLEGVYRKKYLYFKDKKIQLYFKKGIKKPKENSKISISSGHLSIYRSTIQIVLHNDSDFNRE